MYVTHRAGLAAFAGGAVLVSHPLTPSPAQGAALCPISFPSGARREAVRSGVTLTSPQYSLRDGRHGAIFGLGGSGPGAGEAGMEQRDASSASLPLGGWDV